MKMRPLAALISLLALLFTSAQSPVPVEKEPRHHVKFENEYARVFDVTLPPGDETLYHTHSNDYVYVSIGDADLKGQVMGSDPASLLLKNGEVRFTRAPVTHRVENTGTATFRTIAVEILRSSGVQSSSLEKIPGHTVVMDNDRVRVERLILEPGQSTGLHRHSLPGMGIAVSGGLIEMETPGQKARPLELKAGDFRWREATAHSIKNVGKKRFEAVDVEWK